MKITDLSLKIFENNAYAARFWFFMTFFMTVMFIIGTSYAYNAGRLQTPVLVMDESRTFHQAPAQELKDARSLQDYLGALAATAFLNRNPDGLDNAPLFNQIFDREAKTYAIDVIKRESDDFKKRNIYQKFVIHRTRVVQANFDTVTMLVEGYVKRIETVDTQEISDARKVKCHFLFVRNGNYGNNKRLPMVCTVMKYVVLPNTDTTESN